MATDFSHRSDDALARAALIAGQTGASLRLVHAVDDDQKQALIDAEVAASEQVLRQDAARLKTDAGLEVATTVVLGDSFQGIAAEADASRPDLVVLGAHRRRLLRDIFIGTTAQRTIRRARWPVLMVNAPAKAAYGQVLLATDLSEVSRHATAQFAALGLADPQDCSLLHVFDAPAQLLTLQSALQKAEMESYVADLRIGAEKALAKFARAAALPGCGQIVHHHSSSYATGILEAAARYQADLVVMASHGRTGLTRALLGSVAEEVLRRADRDVLAIPPARAD